MSDRERKRAYAALRRAHGQTISNPKLEAANEEADDWQADCRFCEERLSGTKKELMAHHCDEYAEGIAND